MAEAIETLEKMLAVRMEVHKKKRAADDEAEKHRAQTEKDKFEALFQSIEEPTP